MTNLSPPTSPQRAVLGELRAARRGEVPLPPLEPDAYARGHAAFEGRSDQRSLIGDHLAERMSRRVTGPVAVLSVGCGDGSLDAPLAAALVDVAPPRPVRYVGIDPFAGSTTAFASAMADLGRSSLSAQVHTATFAGAPVEGPFDVVTFVHSMYYVPDIAATLRSAHALLGPGGELVVLSARRGALNLLADALAPPLDGHRQWFSEEVAAGFATAGFADVETATLDARLDLDAANDEVLDFTVQARLTPELRPLVRDYLDAVAVPSRSTGSARVPHPVDVYRIVKAA